MKNAETISKTKKYIYSVLFSSFPFLKMLKAILFIKLRNCQWNKEEEVEEEEVIAIGH